MKQVKLNTDISERKKLNIYDACVYLIVFFTTIYISSNVELFSDDFTYKQAGVCEINEIIQFLKWHVSSYNGRTLIHFMEMMILRYDFGFTVWKISIGLWACIFCWISAKITTAEKNDFSKASLLTAMCFFGINPCIWNESVFWVSGSFNYFIPTMMLLCLMLLVRYRPESKWIFPICFICGATTEQVGMMTFGFFTILLLEHLIRTHKILIRHVFYCLLSVTGYATVLLSPGTFSRVETQNKLSLKIFIENVITILQENWFGNFNLFVIIVPTTVFISYWVIKHGKQNKLLSKISIPFLILLWTLTVFNIGIKGISVLNEAFGVGIVFSDKVNMLIFAVWLLYVIVYFIAFLLAAILIYIKERDHFPFTFFVLGFGSQIMMSVAGKSYFRTCLPMLFMIILFETYSGVKMWNDFKSTELFNKKKNLFNTKKLKVLTVFSLISLCLVFIMLAVPNMYHTEKEMLGIEITALNSEELKAFTDKLDRAYIRYYSDPESDWNRRKDILDFSKY